MRIVIDASSLLVRSAGVKTYMHYWIRSLMEAAGDGTIRLFPFLPKSFPLDHERSNFGRWRTLFGLWCVQLSNLGPDAILELPLALADVFHSSQHVRNPPRRLTKLTATIYDMTCWLMPEMHVPANVEGTRAYGQKVLRNAKGCIAISESSRQDAIEILGFRENQVVAIYPGVADEFFDVTPQLTDEAARKYGLDKPYAFFVGMIEPRKNVEGLVAAYERLPAAVRSEMDLVIAGPFGWCGDELRRRLLSPAVRGVRYLGYVPESDVAGLTAGATMFVFPSFYEGFGIPVAQAMAAGVPVITSCTSSLKEIACGAAILVDPRQVEDIAASMELLWSQPQLRADLVTKARSRAERYRWATCAQESFQFFQHIAEG